MSEKDVWWDRIGKTGLVLGIIWAVVQILRTVFPDSPQVALYCHRYPGRSLVGIESIEKSAGGLVSDMAAAFPGPQGRDQGGLNREISLKLLTKSRELRSEISSYVSREGQFLECEVKNLGKREARGVQLIVPRAPVFGVLDEERLSTARISKHSVELGTVPPGVTSHLVLFLDDTIPWSESKFSLTFSEGLGKVYFALPAYGALPKAAILLQGAPAWFFLLPLIAVCLVYLGFRESSHGPNLKTAIGKTGA